MWRSWKGSGWEEQRLCLLSWHREGQQLSESIEVWGFLTSLVAFDRQVAAEGTLAHNSHSPS